jgi:hypothetical protein
MCLALPTGAYEYEDKESDNFAKVSVTLVFDSSTGIVTLAASVAMGFGPFSMAASMVGSHGISPHWRG